MRRSSRPRATAKLSKSLNHQLNAYALAAGAAGVGVLALAPPVEAKIIYTRAHAKVVFGGLPIDLNHDGIVDFYLVESGNNSIVKLSACQYVRTFANGSIFCTTSSRGTNAVRGRRNGAAVLRSGARIQNGEQFANYVFMGEVQPGTGSNTVWVGPWVNGGKGVKNRYLGLKFKIKGQFHYGWARVTVATTSDRFTATLTGYAYETVPGRAITAGETKGSDDDVEENSGASLTHPVPDIPQPASLGALALGAPGLSIWRREDSVVATIEMN